MAKKKTTNWLSLVFTEYGELEDFTTFYTTITYI